MHICKKQINRISFLLIALSFIMILFIPNTFASDTDEITFEDWPNAMVSQINEGVFKQVEDTFFNDDYYTKIIEDGGNTSAINVIATAVIGVAGGLCTFYAYIRFIKEVQRGQDIIETLLKVISQTALSVLILIFISDILGYLDGLGKALFHTINDSLGLNDKEIPQITLEHFLGENYEDDFFYPVNAIFILIIPWVASMAMSIVAKICAFSIIVEIALRKALAPFAVAQVSGEGLRGNGFRYFKRYFAQYIKMMAVLGICAIGRELMYYSMVAYDTANGGAGIGSITDAFGAIIAMFASQFTCIGMMFKTGEIANDVIGQ